MAPTLSPQSAKDLKAAADTVKMALAQDKKIKPLYEKMAAGLKQGIADGDEDEILLYQPQVRKAVEQVNDSLNTVTSAIAQIANLRRDEVVMEAKFSEVETLLKAMAPLRKRLTGYVEEARDLDKQAEKAAKAAKTSSASAEADLSTLKDQVGDLKKYVEQLKAQAAKEEKAAGEAWKAKKQKPLTDARVKLLDIRNVGQGVLPLKLRVEKFRKSYPDLDRERKAEAQWLLDDLGQMDDWFKALDKIVKELVALGQVPVDEKKAPPPPKLGNAEVIKILKAFGLDTKDAGKLAKAAKVVNSCKLDDWPKELAKVYGVKESELKAKMNGVRNLPFVKPLWLIDI